MNSESLLSSSTKDAQQDISTNLVWIDLIKGMAIIGVVFDNWMGYFILSKTSSLLYSLGQLFALAVGPFVQVFFILSGFGLTVFYYKNRAKWSWRKWSWRRFTKIVIPYQMAVLLSYFLGIIGFIISLSPNLRFSVVDYLKHAFFAQNFYPEVHAWNPPLWFMPAIIGLYLIFPVLLKILNKFGPWVLLLLSLLMTYGSLLIAVLLDIYQGHGTDVFAFWTFQFSLGMILAYIREKSPRKLNLMIGIVPFFIGLSLLALSWAIRSYVPMGKVFNDSLTSAGIFLVLLNIVWLVKINIPKAGKMLSSLSAQSYLIFLIHYPVMCFTFGPALQKPLNPILAIILGGIYIVFIYYISKVLSNPVNSITRSVYKKFV